MSKEYLRKLDEEDGKLVDELSMEEELTLDKVLGFRLPKAKCFVLPVPCGDSSAPLMSLVPMYEAAILPIYSSSADIAQTRVGERWQMNKIIKASMFKRVHGLLPDELAILAEKGRVIPYFEQTLANYNGKIIKPFLEPGVPKITRGQMLLIRGLVFNQMSEDKEWADMQRLAGEDIAKARAQNIEKLRFHEGSSCDVCLSACYLLGLRKYFQSPRLEDWTVACFVSNALSTQVLDAVLQTECLMAQDVLSNVGELPDEVALEFILRGLKVNYAPNIPLEAYVDIFNGKTSKALRKIVTDLLNDPLSRKYSQRLSAKIYDLNQQVEELAEGRTAKVFGALSDMALYGGKKFIESKSQQLIKVPKKGFVKLGEWLASKGVDLQAKIHRQDWSIAQLYKARCQLERYK